MKSLTEDSLKKADECIQKNDNFKYSNKTYLKLLSFKNNIFDLHELLSNLESAQMQLENNMLKANVLQKNQDLFMKLKQAEQFYKTIIDYIQGSPKIMSLLKVKDSITDTLNSLRDMLSELPYGMGEYNAHLNSNAHNNNNHLSLNNSITHNSSGYSHHLY